MPVGMKTVRGSLGVPALVETGPQSFARSNNATAYTAGDVVSDSALVLTPSLTFPVALGAGGGGYFVKAQLETNSKTFLSQMRLYLFTSPLVVVAGDNLPATQLYANMPFRVGYIDFPTLVTGAGAGSTSSIALWTGNLEFRCADGDTQLYGSLVDATGSTPAAFQSFSVTLMADVYA